MKSHKSSIFPIIESDLKLNKLYFIHKKLSNGCFGYLFLVTNKLTNRRSALKIQIIKNDNIITLVKEYKYLKKLSGIKGIPNVYNFGKTDRVFYMELDLLQTDINYLGNRTNKVDNFYICELGANLIQILEKVHSKNIIHRDIKPQNIMFDKNNNIYLIDFGISKQLNKRGNNLNQSTKNNSFVGTPRYASINAHKGKQQSALDDIQSLLYNLIYLMKKTLPWMNMRIDDQKKLQTIMLIKIKKPKAQLCKDLPKCILSSFQYISKLKNQNGIDYKYLIDLFKQQSLKQIKSQQYKVKSNHELIKINQKTVRRTSLQCNNNFLALPICNVNSQNSILIQQSEQVLVSARTIQKQEQIWNMQETETAQQSVEQKIRLLKQRHLVPRFKINFI